MAGSNFFKDPRYVDIVAEVQRSAREITKKPLPWHLDQEARVVRFQKGIRVAFTCLLCATSVMTGMGILRYDSRLLRISLVPFAGLLVLAIIYLLRQPLDQVVQRIRKRGLLYSHHYADIRIEVEKKAKELGIKPPSSKPGKEKIADIVFIPIFLATGLGMYVALEWANYRLLQISWSLSIVLLTSVIAWLLWKVRCRLVQTGKLIQEKERKEPSDLLFEIVGRLLGDKLLGRILIAAASLFLVSFILRITYFHIHTSGIMSISHDLDYTVKYSPWLAVGDEHTFDITLTNYTSTDLTDVKVCLISPKASALRPAPGTSFEASFDKLAVGISQACTFRLLLYRGEQIQESVRAVVRAEELGSERELTMCPFAVLPLPHLKTGIVYAINLLGGTIIVGLIGGLLKKGLEKALSPN
jgi:hypothetical protein